MKVIASGIAREQRGAVEHDADARSFFLHLGDHMLKEQQGTVGCAWCAGEKPSVGILRFGRHELFFAFPGYAEGRIGDHDGDKDGEHTAGAAAGIKHRADLALALQVFPVARKHQGNEQLLDQQEQAVVLKQLLHRLIQLEILDDIVNVLRKPVDI